jgi:hypothetical protein
LSTAEKTFFAPTHTLETGVLVMKNPDWVLTHGPSKHWVDAEGNFHRTGAGAKATPIAPDELPSVSKTAEGGEFGVTFAKVGDIIPAEWWRTQQMLEGGAKGVMLTREQAGVALRACAWPDSDAPCGVAGNSHDDEATFENKDKDGNCIVRVFLRRKGYVRLRIASQLYFEVVE